MLYLVLVPVALALGVYLVPLQIGAARPRAAAARARSATGSILAGGLTMYARLPDRRTAPRRSGWTAFYPLSGDQHARASAPTCGSSA